MAMDRILAAHAGVLPRSTELRDLVQARADGSAPRSLEPKWCMHAAKERNATPCLSRKGLFGDQAAARAGRRWRHDIARS
jgi:hypothetical protein